MGDSSRDNREQPATMIILVHVGEEHVEVLHGSLCTYAKQIPTTTTDGRDGRCKEGISCQKIPSGHRGSSARMKKTYP